MYKKIKELYGELELAETVPEKVRVLSKLAFFHLNTEPAKCEPVLQQMKEISEAAHYQEGIASAYNGWARLYYRHMDYERAKVYYHQAAELLEDTKDLILHAKVLDGLGIAYSATGHMDEGELWILQAIDKYQEANEPSGLAANCMSNLGNLWSRRGDLDMAEKWYRKGLDELEAKGNLENGTAIRVNLGILYNMQGKYLAAKAILLQSMQEFQERTHRLGVAACKLYLGKTYMHLHDYAEVLAYVQKALVTFKDMGHREFIADSRNTLGETYLALGGVNDALVQLKQSHKIYADIQHMDNLIQTKLLLAKAHVMQQDKANARIFLEESMALAQQHQFTLHEQEAKERLAALDKIEETGNM